MQRPTRSLFVTPEPEAKGPKVPYDIILYSLDNLFGDSDNGIVQELHADLRHFGFFADEMGKLKRRGITHIFVEIDEGLTEFLQGYQKLRKKEFTSESGLSSNEIEQLENLVAQIYYFTAGGADIGKFGYFMRMLDAATFHDIAIIAIDMRREKIKQRARRAGMTILEWSNSDKGMEERDEHMAGRINEHEYGKALISVGAKHAKGMGNLLGITLVIEILDENSEKVNKVSPGRGCNQAFIIPGEVVGLYIPKPL